MKILVENWVLVLYDLLVIAVLIWSVPQSRKQAQDGAGILRGARSWNQYVFAFILLWGVGAALVYSASGLEAWARQAWHVGHLLLIGYLVFFSSAVRNRIHGIVKHIREEVER